MVKFSGPDHSSMDVDSLLASPLVTEVPTSDALYDAMCDVIRIWTTTTTTFLSLFRIFGTTPLHYSSDLNASLIPIHSLGQALGAYIAMRWKRSRSEASHILRERFPS